MMTLVKSGRAAEAQIMMKKFEVGGGIERICEWQQVFTGNYREWGRRASSYIHFSTPPDFYGSRRRMFGLQVAFS